MNGENKPLSYYFVKNLSLDKLYNYSSRALRLVNSFLIITHLSVFHFGLYQLVLSFVRILESFNIKGLDDPLTTEMRHYLKNDLTDRAKRIFFEMAVWRTALALVLGAAVFAGSGMVARWYGEDIGLLIAIVSPLLLLYSLESLEVIILKAVISFAHWGLPFVRELAKFLIIIVLVLTGQFTITTIILATVIAQAAAVLVLGVFFVWKKYRQYFSGASAYGKFLIFNFIRSHGKWIFLRFGLSRVTKNAVPWLIKFFLNTEAVALYTLAINLVSFAQSFIPVSGIAPLMLLKLDKKDVLGFLFRQAVKYVFWIGIAGLLGAFFVGPWLTLVFFPAYAPAVPIFRIMLFVLPIFGMYKILKITLSVLREYKILAMRILNEAVIIIAGLTILLPTVGILGAGIVYVATYLERVVFFYTQLIKRHPEFKLKPKHFLTFNKSDVQTLKKIVSQAIAPFRCITHRL